MLAGILFPICLAPVQAAVQLPLLALPPIVVWLVLTRFAPRWAVAGAVVVTVVAVVISVGPAHRRGAPRCRRSDSCCRPSSPLVLVGLGIPLYIVTMAGQNVPGFAVLRTFGYDEPAGARDAGGDRGRDDRSVRCSARYTLNLSAITAAMMAGPDAASRPRSTLDRDGRLRASPTSCSASAREPRPPWSRRSPPILIDAVAGLALLGALIGSAIATSLEAPAAPDRRGRDVPGRRVGHPDRSASGRRSGA